MEVIVIQSKAIWKVPPIAYNARRSGGSITALVQMSTEGQLALRRGISRFVLPLIDQNYTPLSRQNYSCMSKTPAYLLNAKCELYVFYSLKIFSGYLLGYLHCAWGNEQRSCTRLGLFL